MPEGQTDCGTRKDSTHPWQFGGEYIIAEGRGFLQEDPARRVRVGGLL